MKKIITKAILFCLLFVSAQLSASTIYGTLVGGVPVVSISFSSLNSSINSQATSQGFASGSLVSYEIVNETGYGYSFKYVYQFVETSGTIHTLHSGIPLVLSGTDFLEDIQIGGRKVTTCKKTNCPEGCELVKDDCIPPCPANPDPPQGTCEKTQTTVQDGNTPAWIGAVLAIINFLRSL